jgi:hypothetical protein
MLRRRSDAPCRNTNTLMLDYHLGNLGGLGGGAGVDGRPGLQRPRAGRGALGAVGVERLQARSTQAAALGRWRVGWGGALARCDGRENTQLMHLRLEARAVPWQPRRAAMRPA